MEMIEGFENALYARVNVLNQAFKNKNYNLLVEESERITKIAYALCIMQDNDKYFKDEK